MGQFDAEMHRVAPPRLETIIKFGATAVLKSDLPAACIAEDFLDDTPRSIANYWSEHRDAEMGTRSMEALSMGVSKRKKLSVVLLRRLWARQNHTQQRINPPTTRST